MLRQSRAALKLFETSHGNSARQSVGGNPGSLTWLSALVTFFMNAVPKNVRLQLPVSGLLIIESGFSPVRGGGLGRVIARAFPRS